MSLQSLKPGQQARIIGLLPAEAGYRQRLLALGLLPGTIFTLVRMAPLGDPIEIIVRGVAITLRKAEAKVLQVERSCA